MATPEQHRKELARRMAAKDLDGTLQLIADDAVYFWSNGAAMFGKAAIAEGLRQNFDSIQDDTFETFDVTWLARSGDIAVCIYRFRWTGEIDGRPAGGHGRGSSALRKVDGQWRTVLEHLSAGERAPWVP
ncbi:MAG: nuclear transport factor 2 family protein [Dehalococcoidia bacterium]|nr:nuclear transport factor 2 family protein [Dehalococcoidia bacterium]